jgi:hypothetical protein
MSAGQDVGSAWTQKKGMLGPLQGRQGKKPGGPGGDTIQAEETACPFREQLGGPEDWRRVGKGGRDQATKQLRAFEHPEQQSVNFLHPCWLLGGKQAAEN